MVRDDITAKGKIFADNLLENRSCSRMPLPICMLPKPHGIFVSNPR